MERYKNKKDLLVHVGRSEKDVRWIDRALERGEVVKRDRGYCLSVEYICELEKHSNGELEKNPVVDSPVVDTSDLDFQIQENERLEGEKQELIEGIKKAFIYFGRGIQWSEFIEKIGVSSLLGDMELE